MTAQSIRGKSPEEIQSALLQSMADGFKPTLSIVFISVKQDRKAVCEILHQKEIDIIGATSCYRVYRWSIKAKARLLSSF